MPHDSPLSLDSLLDHYTRSRLRTASAHTARKYRVCLNLFREHIGQPPTLANLDDDTLADFRDAQFTAGKSPATANSYLAHLVALWNWAWRRGWMRCGPTVAALPEIQREPASLTVGEVGALLSACNALDYSIADIPARGWWRSLILTLYDTGLRVSACRSARWADLRADDRTLLIRGESQKTRKDARRKLHADTLTAILDIAVPARDTIWPWDRCHVYFWRLSRELFLAAGLPDDRRKKLHAIRRTHGTILAAALGDAAAADALQHSSVNTFRKYYRDGSQIPTDDYTQQLPRPKTG